MKKVNKFLALLAMTALFAGCNNEDPKNDGSQESGQATSYVGTMVVVQKDQTTYTQENVAVDYEITDTAGLVLTFKQVAFSPKMPVKIDMILTNVQHEESVETTSFSGDSIVPIAMGGLFPQHTVTSLSGTIQQGTMSLSMTCGGYPITFVGTVQK